MTIYELNKLFDEIDKDGSGEIEYTEFITATINKKKLLDKDKLLDIFTAIDADGSGSISIDELMQFFNQTNNSGEWK